MKTPSSVVAALLLASPAALAQDVGSRVRYDLPLQDFAQTPAKSFSDFVGRAVLLEFFAYW